MTPQQRNSVITVLTTLGLLIGGALYVASPDGEDLIDTLARRPTRTRQATRTATPTRTAIAIISPTSTATPTPTATETATLTPTATATNTPTATPTDAPVGQCPAYPLGAFGLPLDKFGEYSGAFESLARAEIIPYLEAAQAAGMRVLLSVGSRGQFQDAQLHFDLAKWKQAFNDKYLGLDLAEFIDDGTLMGIALLDEPQDAGGNWGGQAVAYSDIDLAAAHALGVVPGVSTWVGSNATWLSAYVDADGNSAWVALGGVFYPYTLKKGEVSAAVAGEVNASRVAGLRLILDSNVVGGGTNGAEPTALQLREWLEIFINESKSEGTMLWTWRTGEYFTRPDIAAVMDDMQALANERICVAGERTIMVPTPQPTLTPFPIPLWIMDCQTKLVWERGKVVCWP